MSRVLKACKQSILPEITVDALEVRDKNQFFWNYFMFPVTPSMGPTLPSEAVIKVSLQEELFMLDKINK